jgi:hypothetical protein
MCIKTHTKASPEYNTSKEPVYYNHYSLNGVKVQSSQTAEIN